MLESMAEKFRVRRDACGDPRVECRDGFVYEHGPNSLGVWIESGKPNLSFKTLAGRWPGLELAQVGEGEFTAIFRPADLGEAARFMRSIGAHKRRRLEEAQREAAIERLRAHQFQRPSARPGADGALGSTIDA